MSPEAIDALVAAGASVEQLAAAFKAEMAVDEARRVAKRAGNAERQRRKRAKDKEVTRDMRDSALHAVTERDTVPLEVSPKDNNQTPILDPSMTDEEAGARKPHRLPAGYRITNADRQFARDLGWTEDEIDDGESEWIDYWSNPKLPASKALKTNWSSVWRNRVRDMGRRRGRSQPARASPRPPSQDEIWMKTVAAVGGRHGNRDHHEPEIISPGRDAGNGRPRGALFERDGSGPRQAEPLRLVGGGRPYG